MASAPSNTAVATSETSARVGTGELVMLSSICVATTTGLPAARALPVICFCRIGTRSTGISTPRSPRATISPSDWAMTASRSAMAAGFSILDMMAAAWPMSWRASLTSSPRCTNDSATQSTPRRRAKSRSALSLSVSGPTGSTVSGRLMPLRLASVPPTWTTASILEGVLPVTIMRILPSSSSSVWPGSTAAKICGCGRNTRCALPSSSVASKRKVLPCASATRSPPMRPIRNFGPCRSARMPIGRSNLASVERMAACTFLATSYEEWLMLMRNTSTPAVEQALDHVRGVRRRSEGGDDLDAPAASHLGLAPASLGSVRRMVQSLESWVSTSKNPVLLKPRRAQS